MRMRLGMWHVRTMEKSMKLLDSIGLLLGTIALTISIKSLCSQKLVVVDVRRAVEITAVMLSKTALSPKAQAQMMQKFSQQLPHTIEAYAKSQRVTIINAQVFVSQNTHDITSIIVRQALNEVRHAK